MGAVASSSHEQIVLSIGSALGGLGLLTPLVNGIRIAGPFQPTWADHVPSLVVIDTEGLGHKAVDLNPSAARSRGKGWRKR
jgi:hypothetical protein